MGEVPPIIISSVVVLRDTLELESFQPEVTGSAEEMVIFLSVVFVDRVMLLPAAKVRVSVLVLAEISVDPILTVLKMSKFSPTSVADIVGV